MTLSRRKAKPERTLLPEDGMRLFDFLISTVLRNARHFVLVLVEPRKMVLSNQTHSSLVWVHCLITSFVPEPSATPMTTVPWKQLRVLSH